MPAQAHRADANAKALPAARAADRRVVAERRSEMGWDAVLAPEHRVREPVAGAREAETPRAGTMRSRPADDDLSALLSRR